MFDTLFLRELADEKRVVLLCNDIAIESLNDHFLLLSRVDDTVMALEDIDVLADAHIAVEVFLALFMQRTPGAEVTPAEVGRTDENLLSFLHDGVVDRDVFTFREQTVDLLLLLG